MFYLLQIVLIDIIKSFNIHVIDHSNFIIFQKTRSDSEYDSYPLPPPSPRAEGGLQEYLYSTRRFLF